MAVAVIIYLSLITLLLPITEPFPTSSAGPSACSIPASPGYTSNCVASLASGSTCIATSCASGYTGSPSGSLTCNNGILSGSFSGCGEWLHGFDSEDLHFGASKGLVDACMCAPPPLYHITHVACDALWLRHLLRFM